MASSGSNSAADKTRKDNFYSPVNFAFYAQRPYQSLPTYCSHIRLLYVRRDAVNNTLYCDLSEGKPLSEVAGSYTAISYCAGDPKSTRVLMVGGLAFNAFANLVQAIEETCCYLHDCGRCGEEKISLWVDQSKKIMWNHPSYLLTIVPSSKFASIRVTLKRELSK